MDKTSENTPDIAETIETTRRRLGIARPRLYTPPTGPLNPETTLGYDVLSWAHSALGWRAMPWQRWLLRHALAHTPDGIPQWRTVLVIVGRQNGKTALITALSLYWLSHGVPLVLGTSSSLDTARESWERAVEYAEDLPDIFGKVKVRRSNGDWQLIVGHQRFKIASANRRGGRGLTVHRLIEDELREHQEWDAHAAGDNSTVAVPDAQTWMLSNAGDDRSVVLNHFRALALTGTDPSLAMYEWSGPEGCELSDRRAWAAANPALGRTITEAALRSKLSQPASVFRTENLAMTVPAIGEAVTGDAWAACLDPGTLNTARSRVVVCLDMSPDLQHATLVAAATLPDGRVRVETVAAWSSTSEVRRELPALLAKIKPRAVGWFPGGPAAAVAPDMISVRRLTALTATETGQSCQGLVRWLDTSTACDVMGVL